MHEPNEDSTKKQKPLKKILELKYTILKNSIQSLKSRFDHAEETISDMKNRTFEIIQS